MLMLVGAHQDDTLLKGVLKNLNLEEKVYFSSCVDPYNFKPSKDDIEKYRENLIAEIEEKNPKIILLLGSVAVKVLLPEQSKISQKNLRNKLYYFKTIPLVFTYAPSYIDRLGGTKSSTYGHLKDDLTWASSIAFGTIEIKDDPVDYRILNSKEEVICLMEHLVKQDHVAFDYETNTKISKNLWRDASKPMCVSFCAKQGEAYGIPLEHPESPFRDDRKWFQEVFGEYLPKMNLIAHNASFEDMVSHKYYSRDIHCKDDTLMMFYLFNPYIKHDLHSFISNFTQIQAHKEEYYEYESVENDVAPLKALLSANLGDVDGTIRAYHKLRYELDEEEFGFNENKMMKQFHPVALQMMENGMKLETDYIRYVIPHFLLMEKRLVDMGSEVFGIKITSPDQLSEFLLSMGFILPHTDGGGHSTDKEALEKAKKYAPKNKHHILEFVKLFKQYAYMNKYYINKIWKQIGNDGRVHPSFKLFGTRSGRGSCSNPNLQNIAKNMEVQKMFTSDGWFVGFDYKTHEFRYFAMLMRDKDLLRDFRRGLDVHTRNATLIFNKPASQITHDERFRSKTLSFGRLFGGGAKTLSEQLGISFQEAKELIWAYDEGFPTIKQYYDWINHDFNEKGYFPSPWGRKWKDLVGLKFAEKVNYPVQGGANYVVWEAGYNTVKAGYQTVSQVHDAIYWEFNHPPTSKDISELYELCTNIVVPGYEEESEGLWDGEFSVGRNLGTMVKLDLKQKH